MSKEYLKSIIDGSSNIVCLLGKAPASEQGCDFYHDDFIYDVEERYGRSPDEICSSTFFSNRPMAFYEFYREEVLKKRGEPDEVNFFLKRLEDAGKLKGIITRGFFDLSKRAGCHNVVHLYGTIDKNFCPHCGETYDAEYILQNKPLPYCKKCDTLIHPGVALSGEILDSAIMTQAIELITSAEVLLVMGCTLQSRLGALARYFTGDKIVLLNRTEHYSDSAADCVMIGEISEMIHDLP